MLIVDKLFVFVTALARTKDLVAQSYGETGSKTFVINYELAVIEPLLG